MYGCEVSFQRVLNLPASYWKADLPVALFPSHRNICCLQYANFVLHVRNATNTNCMGMGACPGQYGSLMYKLSTWIALYVLRVLYTDIFLNFC